MYEYWLNIITGELKITYGNEIPGGQEWKEISQDDYEFYAGLEQMMRENGE